MEPNEINLDDLEAEETIDVYGEIGMQVVDSIHECHSLDAE